MLKHAENIISEILFWSIRTFVGVTLFLPILHIYILSESLKLNVTWDLSNIGSHRVVINK